MLSPPDAGTLEDRSTPSVDTSLTRRTSAMLPYYRDRLYSGVPLFSTRLVREFDIPYANRVHVRTPEDVANLLLPYYADKDREEMLAVLLDTGKSVIGIARLSQGSRNASLFEPAALFRAAILAGADSIVLAHNHPSGNVEPSRQDVLCAKQATEAGDLLGIPVHDSLVIGDGFVSLAERGLV